jgi:hypothetical protein
LTPHELASGRNLTKTTATTSQRCLQLIEMSSD